MASASPPLFPGQKGLATFANDYSRNLGRYWIINGAAWRMVKAAAALTSITRATLVSAISGGLPTYVVNTTTTASDVNVMGVCSSVQVDLAIGDFFLIQCGGFTEVISAAAIASSGLVGTSTTAKKCDDLGIAAGVGQFAVALEAAAGVDEFVGVRLMGLV